MPPEDAERLKLIERLSLVTEQLSESVATIAALDIDWQLVPAVPDPLAFLDSGCTQNNQCKPNGGCQQNSSC